ncbi:MAG: hypothetical protein QM762_08765 [Chryseolinea sp.]
MKKLQPVQPGKSIEPSVNKHMEAVASNLNLLTGNMPGAEKLQQLPATATLADVIETVNVIIRRMS